MGLSFAIMHFPPRVSRLGLFGCFLPFILATVLFQLFSWDQPAGVPQDPDQRSPHFFCFAMLSPPCPASPPPSFYFPPGSAGFPWFLLALAQVWHDMSGMAILPPPTLVREEVYPRRKVLWSWVPPAQVPSQTVCAPHTAGSLGLECLTGPCSLALAPLVTHTNLPLTVPPSGSSW